MDVGTAMSVVQTLFAALQCSELKEFCSIAGYKSQLDQLRRTVARIQAVLVDAEAKQELSQEEMVYIEELKEAVYEADDLFDEFVTLAQQKKLTKGIKVRLFSLFTKLGVAFRMSQKVDKIKKKLDDIAYNNQFSFKHDPEPMKKRSRETCSYVDAVDIIGRENDLEAIVGMLLDSDVQRDVSFLSIVGIGGLGKTALAQLVLNDPRVISAFPVRLWTCVADQDQKELHEKEILGKILEAATEKKHHDASKDLIQRQLRQELAGRKYLLVLDDVWTENRVQWRKLVSFLMGGLRGSWILVTTRSHETARIVGDGPTYELQGLSKENSWCLFERTAFGSELSKPPEDLVNIGHKIVERCSNVPLAIRVAGSLLYGQEKHKWLSFQEFGLTKIEESKNDIMPILKLSYHQLESPLKSCFGFCALFPKDSVMQKETLVRLWMAQGYISSDDERRMEDVAEEFFSVLLHRCFFQDVEKDDFGDIESCKVHDLMHDVAQEVSGKEICMISTFNCDMDKSVRHVNCISGQSINYTFRKTSVRSFLHGNYLFGRVGIDEHSLDTLVANWKYLRVLRLDGLNLRSIPSSIAELLHIRYLDLSVNPLEMLPKQITKLYNLQTLLLTFCSQLKELPKDISKLVKLRVLDIRCCDKLSCMPIDIGKLDYLQELTMFVVGEADSTWNKFLKSLENLKALKNLKGFLEINITCCKKDEIEENNDKGWIGGEYIRNKQQLNQVKFRFSEDGRQENDEAVINELQPHFNLKELEIWHYKGVRMPKWAQTDNFANLVNIEIRSCPNLWSLGCLGNLDHLKFLCLFKLEELKYLIENNSNSNRGYVGNRSGDPDAVDLSLFPSLEILEFKFLPKLKGWWRGGGMEDNNQTFWLPRLKSLSLFVCPNLTAVVECPVLENLDAEYVNKNLEIRVMGRRKRERIENGDEKSEPTFDDTLRLKEVRINNLKWLNSLQHFEAFQCLQSMHIYDDGEVESLGEACEVFHRCSSSLRYLSIESCWNLKSMSGGLEHLTALEKLVIRDCPKLRLSEDGERGDSSVMPWQSLNHSLRILKLDNLPLLMKLPNWIQNLTALQTLHISYWKGLESLPNWMSNLTSLRKLRLKHCSERLRERVQDPTGEDWPHIKHISSIVIR